MAKVAKPKKRETSAHSRAFRRNATPPTDLAKSTSKPSTEENEHWLYNAQSAGVHKKTKSKKLTRQQRVRQTKALERADRNEDRLERKIEESKQKGRKVQARRKDWNELNQILDDGELIPTEDVNGKREDAGGIDGLEKEPDSEKILHDRNTSPVAVSVTAEDEEVDEVT